VRQLVDDWLGFRKKDGSKTLDGFPALKVLKVPDH
jgi:hypothetical protein